MKLQIELLEPFDDMTIPTPFKFMGSTLNELVDTLFANRSDEDKKLIIKKDKLNSAMIVLINSGRVSDLDYQLNDGDEIVISRTISGG